MAYKFVDKSVASPGMSLASVVLQRISDNIRATQQSRTRGGTIWFDVRDPLAMCGIPADTQDTQTRSVYPIVFRLSDENRVNEITVRFRYNTPLALGCTVGICAISVDRLWEPPPADENTVTLSGSTTGTGSLSVSVQGLGPVVVVFLTCVSEFGTAELLYEPGSPDVTGLDEFRTLYVKCALNSDARQWAGSTTVSDEIAPYRLELGRAAATKGGTFDHTQWAWDEDRTPQAYPPALLCRRIERVSSNEAYCMVWPPDTSLRGQLGTYTEGTDEGVRRVPMGYVKIYGMEIYESGIDALGSRASSLDPGSPLSATVLQSLVVDQETVFAKHSRLRCVGNQPKLGDDDTRVGAWNVSPGSRRVPLSTTWDTLASAVIGSADTYKLGPAGSQTERVSTTVDSLVTWVAMGDPNTEPRGGFDIRLRFEDLDGTGGVNSDTLEMPDSTGLRLEPIPRSDSHLPGYWIGHQNYIGYNWNRHCLSGCYPETLWGRIRFQHVSITYPDSNTGTRRRALLQVQYSGDAPEGLDRTAYMVLGSWCVSDTKGNKSGLIGG